MKYFFIIIFLLSCIIIKAQSPGYNPVFDDEVVNSIYIIINEDSLDEMYDELDNTHEYATTFIYVTDDLTDTLYNEVSG